MALSYPLDMPETVGIETIEIRARNAVTTSQSPFTYKQQVIAHKGQKWEATVTIPPLRRNITASWKAMLIGLKGQTGTFLLGDPDYYAPRGTVLSCSVTGSVGDETVVVTMDGSLLAGDYIQLGTGSSARLHTVLVDQIGDGSLEIWPALRDTYSSQEAIFVAPKGVFRLAQDSATYSINSSSAYGISFEAVEVIT